MSAIVLSIGCYAQDMIVKKDGSIIQAKVSEIGTSEVKYKKWSNQDGPSYAIAKSDILAITYQNGEKETFEDATPSTSSAPTQHTSKALNSKSPENIAAIQAINNATFYISDNKLVSKRKKTRTIGLQYGITDNSTIQSDILSIKIDFCRGMGFIDDKDEELIFDRYTRKNNTLSFLGKPAFIVTLSNNSDRLIYVDLANTFAGTGKKMEPYYIPSATSTSATSTSGTAFNLGGITNGLGIGGVIGSLANATTVGSGSGSTTSSVIYSQRVVSIPPHSTIDLQYKKIASNEFLGTSKKKGFRQAITYVKPGKDLYIGEEIFYEDNNSPFKLNFYATISFDDNFSESFTSSVTLYCKKVVGIKGSKNLSEVDLDPLKISNECIYSFGKDNK